MTEQPKVYLVCAPDMSPHAVCMTMAGARKLVIQELTGEMPADQLLRVYFDRVDAEVCGVYLPDETGWGPQVVRAILTKPLNP